MPASDPASTSVASEPQGPAASGIAAEIQSAGGWIPFDRFMHLALYAPDGGYYSSAGPTFGERPEDGSDFITAPELSPLFGRALARQVLEALNATGTQRVIEFGAGSGALAEQLLDALPGDVAYCIVEVSAALARRQQQRLARFGARVQWASRWPEPLQGVVIGNEVLDAMPVKLLAFDGAQWRERGVVLAGAGFAFADRDSLLSPPNAGAGFAPGAVTEIHPQAEAFIRSLAERLLAGGRGAALFIDYGFPEAEYHLPARHGGTLMCHLRHRAHPDPLVRVGEQDITAHVNWSAMALAAQDAGLAVLGYTSQAHLLLNCGLAQDLATASPAERARALLLINEHEMGELFKALLLATPNCVFEPVGFVQGDRSHRL